MGEEIVRKLLEYAIRAPSTHNTQPWLFKITKNSCKFYIDERYRLPQGDVRGRDIHISLGCAIENFIIAAKFFNVFDRVSLDNLSESNLVGEVFLKQAGEKDPTYAELAETIKWRINARGIFEKIPVPASLVESARNIAREYNDDISIQFVDAPEKIESIARLTETGLHIAYKNKAFRKEMSRWMKNSLTSSREGIPGYALKMPLLHSFIVPTLIRFIDIGKKLGRLNFLSVRSAPLITVVFAKKDSPRTWVEVGRLSERIMLFFNNEKWNTSIFVASIEMGELSNELRRELGTNLIPQFLFVVGKATSVHKPTPRHELNVKIVE